MNLIESLSRLYHPLYVIFNNYASKNRVKRLHFVVFVVD